VLLGEKEMLDVNPSSISDQVAYLIRATRKSDYITDVLYPAGKISPSEIDRRLDLLGKGITPDAVRHVATRERFGLMRGKAVWYWSKYVDTQLGPAFFSSLLNSSDSKLRAGALLALSRLASRPLAGSPNRKLFSYVSGKAHWAIAESNSDLLEIAAKDAGPAALRFLGLVAYRGQKSARDSAWKLLAGIDDPLAVELRKTAAAELKREVEAREKGIMKDPLER